MTKMTKLTLYGDQTKGIYFLFNCYKFHITKDTEFNAIYTTNICHLWCLCDYFKDVEDPVKHVHVTWLFGAAFLEEKHKAFLTGEITQQEFEQYLWDKVHIYIAPIGLKRIRKRLTNRRLLWIELFVGTAHVLVTYVKADVLVKYMMHKLTHFKVSRGLVSVKHATLPMALEKQNHLSGQMNSMDLLKLSTSLIRQGCYLIPLDLTKVT